LAQNLLFSFYLKKSPSLRNSHRQKWRETSSCGIVLNTERGLNLFSILYFYKACFFTGVLTFSLSFLQGKLLDDISSGDSSLEPPSLATPLKVVTFLSSLLVFGGVGLALHLVGVGSTASFLAASACYVATFCMVHLYFSE